MWVINLESRFIVPVELINEFSPNIDDTAFVNVSDGAGVGDAGVPEAPAENPDTSEAVDPVTPGENPEVIGLKLSEAVDPITAVLTLLETTGNPGTNLPLPLLISFVTVHPSEL